MTWNAGFYFSAKEIEEDEKFLSSQGLSEAQVKAISIWLRGKIVGQLWFWTSLIGVSAFVAGLTWSPAIFSFFSF